MDSCDLDDSWIEQQERLVSINKNYYREPMTSISVHFVYINSYSSIEKIVVDSCPLIVDSSGMFSILSKEHLLKLVQTRKQVLAQKYKLMDILIYNIDIEPNKIQSFSLNHNGSDNRFFHTLSVTNDIRVSASVFIFHGVNGIFFLFREPDTGNKHTMKSILKNPNQVRDGKTRRRLAGNLRWQEPPLDSSKGAIEGTYGSLR